MSNFDPANRSSMEKEYQNFMESNEMTPPRALDHQIVSQISAELTPSHLTVFLKLVLIQAFVGTLTLIFCPQFEISLTNRFELFHFFHRTLGRYGCMAICGSIFIGTGAAFAGSILSLSEINRIRQSRLLYFCAITGLAATLFLLLGAEIYFDAMAVWFIGAVTTGIGMIETNNYIRKRILVS